MPTVFSLDELLGEPAIAAPLRARDLDVQRLFGLSLAAYNAMVQFLVAAACLLGLRWITKLRLGPA